MLVGSAATMLLFPLGVIGARGLRILTAKWWWAHGKLRPKYEPQSLNPVFPFSRASRILRSRTHRRSLCPVSRLESSSSNASPMCLIAKGVILNGPRCPSRSGLRVGQMPCTYSTTIVKLMISQCTRLILLIFVIVQ